MDPCGRLIYTKRGSCQRYRYDFEQRNTLSSFDPALLWEVLLSQAVTPPAPPVPADAGCSLQFLTQQFKRLAQDCEINDVGVRLSAFLTLMEGQGGDPAQTLESLIGADWTLQCLHMSDDPFPSLLLLRRLWKGEAVHELRPEKLPLPKLLRWSRKFERDNDLSKRTKPLGNLLYENIFSGGPEFLPCGTD